MALKNDPQFQATLKGLSKALTFAKKNPNHADSVELRRRMEAGQLNFELKALGKTPVPMKQSPVDMSKAFAGVEEVADVQTLKPEGSRVEKQITGAASDVGEDFLEMGEDITESFKERTERQAERIERRAEDGTSLVESLGTGLGFARETLGLAVDAVEAGGLFVAKAFMTPEQEASVEEGVQRIGGQMVENAVEHPVLGPMIEDSKKIVASYNKWAEENPQAAESIGDVTAVVGSLAEVVTGKAGGTVAKESVDAAVDTIQKTAPKVAEGLETAAKAGKEALEVGAEKVDAIFTPSQAKLEAKVNDLYARGVKPTIQGKKNIGDVERSKAQQLSAVRSINESVSDLKFKDDIGEITEGVAPASLNEFSQSIQQTKENIYKQYNDLSKQTGEAGVTVNPSEFVDELDVMINDRAVEIAAPETVAYAKKMKETYGKVEDLTPEEIENLIKLYNQDLQTFYKNPSSDQGRKVAVDALIVNNLRKQLDTAVETTTGSQYQVLKTKYGALRAIEKDVLNATLRDARRNVNGLIDYTDIFTGGELAAGILTMNPALLAKAATQKGIKDFFKFRNNPNNQIKRMFEIDATLYLKQRVLLTIRERKHIK